MSSKKEETASFVLRLSQKIFEAETGEHQIEWRGNIRHVQSGEEVRFSNVEDAESFVQKKLTSMTMKAVEDKPDEAQKGILSKSFDFWKKVATATPKLVMDSIKDPKKQAEHLQDQIQEQIHQISDAIGQKLEDTIGSKIELDNILPASKAEIIDKLDQLTSRLEAIESKLDKLKSTKKG
ncbi:MAG: hypothetical protein IPO98_05025 [Saprospiraceae bacterium]|nr:hypothetical protein [Saprospiraceae bacterium]